jgi:hypothetical protein
MAHFAEIDSDGNVVNVIVVADEDTLDVFGEENEDIGIDFCQRVTGSKNTFKQTSFNMQNGVHRRGKSPMRGNFARVGGKYDAAEDLFLDSDKPYPSWVLDKKIARWVPPEGMPDEGNPEQGTFTCKTWNEQLKVWE